MIEIEPLLADAIREYWRTRGDQRRRQGLETGSKDAGERSAVTGGRHADGFVRLIAAIVRNADLPQATLRVGYDAKVARTLPGHFRPTKEWDIIVTSGDQLVAAAEVKSQVGSFGNNFNNRVEEAIGSSHDLWTAYREGRFAPSRRP